MTAPAVVWAELQGRLGEALFRQALRHRSDRSGPHSERLEWLGDSVLDLLVAERLLRLRPEWDEGRLSQERARLVCTAALAGHARRLGLGERLSVGGSARPAEVRNSEKALCDGVEALVGAGFAAGGLPVAEWVAGAMGLLPWVARGTGALP